MNKSTLPEAGKDEFEKEINAVIASFSHSMLELTAFPIAALQKLAALVNAFLSRSLSNQWC